MTGFIGTGNPAGAVDDPRVQRVVNALVFAEGARSDIAARQLRKRREVFFGKGDGCGGADLCFEAGEIYITVSGDADGQRLTRAVGIPQHHEYVLERIGGVPWPVVTGERHV